MRVKRGLAALVAGALAFVAVAALAAPAPQKEAARPNIWGVWNGFMGGRGVPFRPDPYPTKPSFTAWGAEQSKLQGGPETPGECDPWGPVGFMGGRPLFPIEILQGPNLILISNEAVVQPRRIFTDGRKHPPADEWLPSFNGHSIGHWEGDTLVVDTIGTNGRTRPLNGYASGAVSSKVETAPRLPASDQLHVVERIRLVGDGDFLEDQITVEDPKVYTQPWTVKHYWQRRPDLDLQEYVCTDNRRQEDEGQHDAGKTAK